MKFENKDRLPLLLTILIRGISFFALLNILQLRMREIGGSLFMVNMLSTINGLTQTIATPIWGAISDNQSRRKYLLIPLIIIPSFFYPFFSIVSIPILLIILRGATSFFQSGFQPITLAMASEKNEKNINTISKEMSLVNISSSVGMLSSKLLLSVLLIILSIKFSFIFLFFVSILSVIPVFFIKENERKKIKKKNKNWIKNLFPIIENPKPFKDNGMWAIYISAFIRQMGITGSLASLTIFMNENIGMSTSLAVGITAINPIAQVVSQMFSVILIKKIGDKNCNIWGIIQSGLSLFIFAFANNYFLIILAYSVLGLAYGIYINGTVTYISRNTDKTRRAEMMGLLRSFRSLGVIIGPIFTGIIIQYSYTLMFILSGSLITLSSLLVILYSKKLK